MKQLIGLLLAILTSSVQAQDTSYYYAGWGKPGVAHFVPRSDLKNQKFTHIKFSEDKAVLLKYYDNKSVLHGHLENEYDQYGNHLSKKIFDKNGQLKEETIFQNDPSEMALFRTVFGQMFQPANSNFIIHREYNAYGRETGYFIIGIRGQGICSRTTIYRDDRRKEKEILRDDLKGEILTERRYKYIDAENRTILEEYDGRGKMTQRVVLFDQHDIIQN